MHKHLHICSPPLPSHVFYQGDASGHQVQSESKDFPALYLVNWRTGNAPVNYICPTVALLSQKIFLTQCIPYADCEFVPTPLDVM